MSEHSAGNLLCNLSALQGCLCSCWLNRFFWATVFGCGVFGFFYFGVVFPLISAVAFTSHFFSYPMVMHKTGICESEFLLLWRSGKSGRICSQSAFHGGLGCICFSFYKCHGTFVMKRIFRIKNVTLWEAVEKKICFTETNTSKALWKDSPQSCLWTKS